MKKRNFIIKKTENGHGIFLRSMQGRPLAVFPTKKAAAKRLNEYIKNVNKKG